MKPFLTIIFITIAMLDCFSQQEKSKNDTSIVYRLLEIASQKSKMNQKDSAEIYYQRAGKKAIELNFTNGFFKYTGEYTNFLYLELRYQDAIGITTEQLKKSVAVGNVKTEANSYNNLALLNYSMSNMTIAADYYVKALELSKKTNDLFNQRKFNTNLASLFIDIKDYDKGLYYAKNGYELAKKLNDSLSIARSLTNLIVVEIFRKEYQQAKAHSDELIAIAIKNNYQDELLTGYINLGNIYSKQENFAMSVNILKVAEAKLHDAPMGYDSYVYHGLASAYKGVGDQNRARHYFEKCMINANETMPLPDLRDVYLLGSELHENINNHKQALYYRKKFQAINDSIAYQTNLQTIQDIETKYQTSIKEQQITEQKLQIANHQNDINRKNNFILTTSLIILFLGASVVFIFVLHRQKIRDQTVQQEVKVLEALLTGEERERTRTAKELHDAVASTLSAAKIQINGIKEDETVDIEEGKNKALHLIDLAVREVRNISHNMAPNVLLEEGLTFAIENFCNKVSNEDFQINTYFFGDLPRLPIEKELIIYRIIQEAINNIIKHAEASEALVQLSENEGHLDITIEDNGKGFDIDNIEKKGIGLSNLLNRITLLNGNYDIQSSPNNGTTIYISFVHGQKK